MTFEPVLPWPILAVVAGALTFARLVTLRQVLLISQGRRGRAALRWTGVSLTVLLLLAAAARPGLRDEVSSAATSAAGTNLNVFLGRRPIGRCRHRGLSRRWTADRGDAQ